MKNEDIKLRVRELIAEKSTGITNFAELIKTNQSSLSRCLSDENSVGDAMINKIVIAFGINKEWILNGTGNKYKDKTNIKSIDIKEEEHDYYPSRPHIDSSYAECGKPGGFSVAVKKEDCEMISLPFLKDYDFSIIASGESMINRTNISKSIQSGDIVACKIVNSRTHVRFGEVYVLSTIDGFTIKKVVPSEIEGCIKCIPSNTEDNYSPFDIPTEEIFDWAFVVGVARINKW
jgi:hypothetical protein